MTFRSLYIQFFLLFLIFGFLIVSVIYVVNSNILRFELKEHEYNSTKNSYKFENKYLSKIIDEGKRNIDNILEEKIFINFIEDSKYKDSVETLFYNYASSKDEILQLRFIDLDGNELIRVQKYYTNQKPEILKIEQLQNKKNSKYMADALKMTVNDFFISELNLNSEFGKIQIPYYPTIRIIKSVFSNNGEKRGLLVLNLNLKSFIQSLEEFGHLKVYLIDKDGNYLFHPESSKRWSKDLKTNFNFKNEFRNFDFEAISKNDEYNKDFLYSYSLETVANNNQDLKLIFFLDEKYLTEILGNSNTLLISIIIPFVLILGLILAVYPSRIRSKLEDSLLKIKENTKITNRYIPISITNEKGIIIYVNDAFCDLTGYEKDELIGFTHSKLKSDNIQKETYNSLWKTIKDGKVWEGELENKKKNGQTYWINMKITPKKNLKNDSYEYVSFSYNISDKKLIEKLAKTDSLTNLANRNRINEELEKAMYNVSRYNEEVSIMILDIDFFKAVNDKFGHNVGDNLLVEFSNILKDSTRKSDLVGRWGGEEFIIIAPNTNIEAMKTLALKIKDNVENLKFKYVNRKTCCIGFTQIQKEDKKIEQVIERADNYLYIAKENGRNKAIGDNIELSFKNNYVI